jgi:2-dehydro-3-deoxyphosphogluconate aldolase/(4S)-4-hydroxy-2-oxoglutarate aldolase
MARRMADAGLIAIIRAASSANVPDAARALWAGGVRVMEVTLNTPGALRAVEAIRAALPQMLCGAGTILQPADAIAAIEAGAQFIITPTLQLDTIDVCNARGVPIAPGCASPAEALAAHRAGAAFIKIFPGATFNLPHVGALLGELPDLRLVPTGGLTPENARGFFDAGCAAVAVGSNLAGREVLESADWPSLTAAARRFVNAVDAARASLTTNN